MVQRFVKISPVRITLDDGVQLPLARPAFHCFLALDCVCRIIEALIIRQLVEIVSACEGAAGFRLVFVYPARKIIRYADIERTERRVGYDIDVVISVRHFDCGLSVSERIF